MRIRGLTPHNEVQLILKMHPFFGNLHFSDLFSKRSCYESMENVENSVGTWKNDVTGFGSEVIEENGC